MKMRETREGEITKGPKVSCAGDGYIHDLHGQQSVHSHTSSILNLQIHNVPYRWPDRSCGMNPSVRLQPPWLTTLPLPSRNPLPDLCTYHRTVAERSTAQRPSMESRHQRSPLCSFADAIYPLGGGVSTPVDGSNNGTYLRVVVRTVLINMMHLTQCMTHFKC